MKQKQAEKEKMKSKSENVKKLSCQWWMNVVSSCDQMIITQ